MKIGIYGAGDFCKTIDKTIDYIGVDGGVSSLFKIGITPKYVIGDFDSFSHREWLENIETKVLPCRKDETDTEVALMEAIRMGYDEINLYGVTGGRLDHFFTVCRLLVKYKNAKITLYDDVNKIFLLQPGCHQISKDQYAYLSFFALKPTHLSLQSVAYPLNNYLLVYEDGLCVSNEIIGDYAIVHTDKSIYCIQSKKEGQ